MAARAAGEIEPPPLEIETPGEGDEATGQPDVVKEESPAVLVPAELIA